jgi:hypothetical protein
VVFAGGRARWRWAPAPRSRLSGRAAPCSATLRPLTARGFAPLVGPALRRARLGPRGSPCPRLRPGCSLPNTLACKGRASCAFRGGGALRAIAPLCHGPCPARAWRASLLSARGFSGQATSKASELGPRESPGAAAEGMIHLSPRRRRIFLGPRYM